MIPIADALSMFFDPADVFEVRAFDCGRTGRKLAGFMRAADLPRLGPALYRHAETAGAVYFTPQRLDPAVLGRCRHADALAEVGGRVKLTHDADVIERRYLLIDVDPVKPSPKVSATDVEKSAARDVAEAVRDYLGGQRWAAPLVIDSGNGWHLYYRLAEPLPGGAADSLTDPMAVVLRSLKARYDTPAATIDGTVFNASRIMKVPGTWARKGKDTPDRPHRPCTVQEVPNDWRA